MGGRQGGAGEYHRAADLVALDPGGWQLAVDDAVDGGEQRVVGLPPTRLQNCRDLVAGQHALQLLAVQQRGLQLIKSLGAASLSGGR